MSQLKKYNIPTTSFSPIFLLYHGHGVLKALVIYLYTVTVHMISALTTCMTPQDSDGDTALHCAVLAQKNESVTILLDAGADPTLLNFRLFTPIHEAARIGFLP